MVILREGTGASIKNNTFWTRRSYYCHNWNLLDFKSSLSHYVSSFTTPVKTAPHLWCYRVIRSRQCAKHNKELLQKNPIYFFTNVQVKVINLTVFFTVHLCYVKYHYFCEWYKSLKNQCRELSTTVELNVHLQYKKDTEMCPKRAISGL